MGSAEAAFMKCFSVLNLVGKLIIVCAFVLHENPAAVWVMGDQIRLPREPKNPLVTIKCTA